MQHVTIIYTADLVNEFECGLGYHVTSPDHLELFKQMFQILDQHSPMDLSDRKVLSYADFIFANHLKVDHAQLDRVAYRILVKLWQRLHYHEFYQSAGLMYFPFSMHGKDLCVRRYNS